MGALGLLTNKWVAGALILVFLAAGCWIGGDVHGNREAKAKGDAAIATLQAQYAAATAKAEANARAKEQASAARVAQVEAYYRQEIDDAQAKSERVAADLRAGNLQLRKQWRGCTATASMPASSASTSQPDAAAEQRSQGASDLVRIAADADATIRALQAVVRSDRQQ